MERSISRHLRGLVLLGFLVIFLAPKDARGIAESTPFKFEGCPVQSMTQAGPLGEYVYIACPGPLGIFVSGDFGENWEFAGGGDYKEGAAKTVLGTKRFIFAIAAGQVYWATPADSHDWHRLDLTIPEYSVEKPISLAADDKTLLVGTSGGRLARFDTGNEITTPVLSGDLFYINSNGVVQNGKISSIAVDDSGIFVQIDKANSSHIFRSKPGIQKHDWQSVRLSAGLEVLPEAVYSFGIYSDGRGTIYVLAPCQGECQGDTKAPFLRSTDSGKSWTRPQVPSNSGAAVRSASFVTRESGEHVHLLGEYISYNSGETFSGHTVTTEPSDGSPSITTRFNGNVVMLNQNDIGLSMMSSFVGPIIYSDIGVKIIARLAISGITGTLVSQIAQSPRNPELALVGYIGGLMISENFGSNPELVQFRGPEVPNINGVMEGDPISSVVWESNPGEPAALVAGSELFRFRPGRDYTNGRWERITPDVGNRMERVISTSLAVIENRLFFGSLMANNEGRIFIYDRGESSWRPAIDRGLGVPVSAIVAASNTTVFAGAGGISSGEEVDPVKKGIWVTNDRGGSWRNVLHEVTPLNSIPSLAYDAATDTLYAAANLNPLLAPEGYEITTNANPLSSEALSSEYPEGTVLRLEKASSDTPVIKSAGEGLPKDAPITSVTFDNAAHMIYASAGQKVYISPDGNVWSLLYEGLTTEDTREAFMFAKILTLGRK